MSRVPARERAALILVDFDDTLVDTGPRFQQARRALFERLGAAGFDPGRAERVHHDEVEPVMIRRHGMGPRRMATSFRETYLHLCAGAGIAPDPATADACAALGHAVAGTPPWLDGALDALRAVARAFPTVVYTQAGDPDYQFRCVRDAGVLDVLPRERVRICERKTPDEFGATLTHYGVREPEHAWMVGNSIRSDINPALATGARAILVETRDPWEYDQVDPLSDDFLRVRSFPDAARLLLRRFATR